MQNTSQVVARNLHLFDKSSLLIVGMPDDDLLSQIEYTQAFTWDYSVYSTLTRGGYKNVSWGAELDSDAVFKQVLLFMPKSKSELDLLFAMVSSRMDVGAELFLVGAKKEGINSAAKKLVSVGEHPEKIDMARHCQLWSVIKSVESAPFNLDDWLEEYEISAGDDKLTAVSIPGVFSHGRLDDATALLLDNLGRIPSGRVLDFGCGCGVLGAMIAKRNPEAMVEMVDINALSLYCAEKTLSRNQLKGQVYPSNGLQDVTGRFNGVFTNPPFHSGVKTNYSITETFIKTLPEHMTKNAPLRLVANSFLKYSALIDAALERFDIVTENTKFRVYKAFR
ncbi:methyltransferase [Alkalimarinus coralli]|uniref:methyltransferase n=1 Tax=Alkalimarinus coralli TaxID=2935863 RepID=UPI00202AC669|nr:methyltransferase [Alkalimarinus coralli]